jgi:hypothetical protein
MNTTPHTKPRRTRAGQWLTRREAAARAGVSLSTIDRQLRPGGRLTKHVSGANAVRISQKELDALYEPTPEG